MKNKSIYCPNCGNHFELTICLQDDDWWVELSNEEDFIKTLRSLLFVYWKTISEGKKYNTQKHRKRYIKYLPEEDVYKFDIQISDSPQGDSWRRGKFRCKHYLNIEIIEKEGHT